MKDEIFEILDKYKRIHVVGLSPNEERASFKVAKYMEKAGYSILGVRPGTGRIGNWPCYSSVSDVPEEIEILDVFRASEHIPAIVDEAIKKNVKVLWLQLGISHPEAEEKARSAGIKVVSNHCLKIEHAERF
jgi:predicted CoA-binding protein